MGGTAARGVASLVGCRLAVGEREDRLAVVNHWPRGFVKPVGG